MAINGILESDTSGGRERRCANGHWSVASGSVDRVSVPAAPGCAQFSISMAESLSTGLAARRLSNRVDHGNRR